MRTNFSDSFGLFGALAAATALVASCVALAAQTADQKTTPLPVPNPYYRTNAQEPFRTYTGPGRQKIMAKLDQIVLPEIFFDNVPLPEVVKFIQEETQRRDPDKKGLNFILNAEHMQLPVESKSGGTVTVTVQQKPAPRLDLDKVRVKINPPLRDLKLKDALDAISKAADQPITFSVEEYAIVFHAVGERFLPIRLFRANPNTYLEGLQGVNPTTPLTPGVGGQPPAQPPKP